MALQESDLLLVGRGGLSYYTTAEDLATFVQGSDAFTYRGVLDLTAAIADQLNPDPPAVGDVYISDQTGTIHAEWSITPETETEAGDRVFFNGNEWQVVQSGAQDVGVTEVDVTAPVTKSGTTANPNIGISELTDSATGVAMLAGSSYDGDGNLNITEAYEVLGKVHFDELNSRITTAAAGGIHTISATAPLTASVNSEGTTASIAIEDASTAQKGAVQLTDTVNPMDSTQAPTGVAVDAYAVPRDLTRLPNLEDA